MRTTALPCAENQPYDMLNSLSILDFCKNGGAAISIWFRVEDVLTCDAIIALASGESIRTSYAEHLAP